MKNPVFKLSYKGKHNSYSKSKVTAEKWEAAMWEVTTYLVSLVVCGNEWFYHCNKVT